jgi:hypothetical protein
MHFIKKIFLRFLNAFRKAAWQRPSAMPPSSRHEFESMLAAKTNKVTDEAELAEALEYLSLY